MARINLKAKISKITGNIRLLYLDHKGRQKVGTVKDLFESSEIKDIIQPYKVYRAIMNQSFPDAPTVEVVENTLGDITWVRVSNGYYRGTLVGAFKNPATKVWLEIPGTCGTGFGFNCIYVEDDDTIGISTSNSSALQSDNMLFNTAVEINIYP